MSTPPQQPDPQSPDAQEPNDAAARPPQDLPRGHYAEVAPGVPKYGQYAPEGFVPPSQPAAPVPQNQTPQPAAQFSYPGQATVTGPRPQPVQRAFVMILAAGGIQLALAILNLFMLPQLRELAQETIAQYGQTGFTSSMIDTSIALTFVFYGISVALYVLVAVKIRAGRNWARILGTVLAGLSLIMLLSLSPLSIAQVALGIFGIVYCWIPASRDYFIKR